MTQPQRNNKYPTHAPYDDEVDNTEENNSTATPYTEQEDTYDAVEEDNTEDQDYYPDIDSGLDEYYTGDDFAHSNEDDVYEEQEDTEKDYSPRRTPFAGIDHIPETTAGYQDFSEQDSYSQNYDTHLQSIKGYSDYDRDGSGVIPPAQVEGQYENHVTSSNWPEFLKTQGNQLFFAMINLVISLGTGIGIILPFYYLFILDDSYKKDKASKVINWVALLLPLIVLFLFVLISLFAIALGNSGPTV